MIYEFTPTQDLHGYDEPWAPGAGANQWDEEWEVGDISASTGDNTPSTTVIRSKNYIPVLPETSYFPYLGGQIGRTLRTRFYGSDKSYIGTVQKDGSDVICNVAFITPEDAYYMRFTPQASYGTKYEDNIAINYPATITTYSPYSNICPPEGYNIWDPTNEEMIQVYSGYVDANANKLYLHPVYEEYDGEELVGPWMSSMDKYTEEGTPTAGAFVVDFGGEVTEYDITDFMLQTLLDSIGVRRFITSGAMLLNSLMDQAQGRVRSEEELLNRSLPLHVIAIGEDLPTNLVIKKPISDVLPGLPGKIKI